MTLNLATADSLFDYFTDGIHEAKERTGVSLTEDTTLYLANLLNERARTDAFAPSELTLAELHGRAAHAPPAERARAYRELGDTALYSLGYFEESLDRQTVGRTYYTEMGAAAYHQVDQVFKTWFSDAFGPVFEELSAGFTDCVHLVTQVRDAHLGRQPDQVLALYQRWTRTGDEAIAKRLHLAGFILPRKDAPEE